MWFLRIGRRGWVHKNMKKMTFRNIWKNIDHLTEWEPHPLQKNWGALREARSAYLFCRVGRRLLDSSPQKWMLWAGCRSGCNCGCRNSIDDIAREHACLSNVTASQSCFGAVALPLNEFFAWPLTTLAGSATLDPSTSAFESRKLCRRAEIQNLIIFSKTFLISYLRLWEF